MQPQNLFNPQNPGPTEHFSPHNREAHSQPVVQPVEPQQPAANAPQPAPYDFIFNSEKPVKKPFVLPGGNSMVMRVLFIVGGLFALLILFVIIKNILVGSPKLDTMVTVAQDQQEIIHLATIA